MAYYYNARGFFFSLIGEYKKAHQDFNKVIKMDTTNRSVYYNRSKMYIKLKEYDKAEADYLKSITIDLNDPEGYYYLGELNELKGKKIRALNNYSLAISKLQGEIDYHITESDGLKKMPESKVYLKRANLYKTLGESELMCEDYQTALQLMEEEPNYSGKEILKNELEEKVKESCKDN